jgi:hypothetical protein
MHVLNASAGTGRQLASAYRERLTPSLKFIVGAGIIAPMVSFVFVRFDATAALVIGVLAAALLVWILLGTAPRVRVENGELVAGRAHIDVAHLGRPQVLTGDEAALARGTGLDPRGWYLIRGGIDGIVIVENIDPADPVTTWTVSTRSPDRLAAAIRRAQNAS